MGISVTDLAVYTPRLLYLHVKAHNQMLRQQQEMSAWAQANIMNRVRWSNKTPTVTPAQLLGNQQDEAPATREEFVQRARTNAAKRAAQAISPFGDKS